MIADFTFYTGTYYGDIIENDIEYAKFATRADAYLEQYTMGRYDDQNLPEDVVTAVKMAQCAVAEVCKSADVQKAAIAESMGAGTLASETVGAHSVSYRSGADIKASAEMEIQSLINRYLGMTGLLYRGISCIRRIR